MTYIDLIDDPKIFDIKKNISSSVIDIDFEDLDDDLDDKDITSIEGKKKEFKEQISKLLFYFIKIMSKHKDTINISHKQIIDQVFKQKEKEKDIITDRLQKKTLEERKADTQLKKNKLGEWGKGLKKGLTTYDKDNYDDEMEFMENMQIFERISQKSKKINNEDFDEYNENKQIENEINKDNDDIDRGDNENDTDEDEDYDDYSNDRDNED